MYKLYHTHREGGPKNLRRGGDFTIYSYNLYQIVDRDANRRKKIFSVTSQGLDALMMYELINKIH